MTSIIPMSLRPGCGTSGHSMCRGRPAGSARQYPTETLRLGGGTVTLCRVLGAIEPRDLPAIVAEDDYQVQEPKRCRLSDQHVNRRDAVDMTT